MDLLTLCQLKSKFVARQVGDELVIVPLSGNVAQMNELFTLNETGKFIWENTDEKCNAEMLAKRMTEAYEIDEATALQDIELFLTRIDVLTKYKSE